MTRAIFVSDLHSSIAKYEHLFSSISSYQPQAVFIAGDLMGGAAHTGDHTMPGVRDFLYDYLAVQLEKIRSVFKEKYPAVFVILGNDDSKLHEAALLDISTTGLLKYVNQQIVQYKQFQISGYSFIPPTPFLNKDWEKYDVSRYVDVGCVSPEEGYRSIPVSKTVLQYYTIKKDLELLFAETEMKNLISIFHSPPYETALDVADLTGKHIDHVPLDIHVGSIAIKEFILQRQPYITLHGHVHESSRLSGNWQEKLGATYAFQGASERGERKLILIDLEDPGSAKMIG